MAQRNLEMLRVAVNAQMAAESFLTMFTRGIDALEDVLVEGNGNASKTPRSASARFVADFEVIAHLDLSLNPATNSAGVAVPDKSGLSATLLRSRDLNEYLLSVRSTEAVLTDSEVSRGIFDSGDVQANAEIAKFGYAIGQLHDLQSFFETHVAPNIGDTKLTVTGYSLGGNLATAFTQLNPDRVQHTYLFNAAGTGVAAGSGGLQQVLDNYAANFADPTAYWGTAPISLPTEDLRSALLTVLTDPDRVYGSVYDNPRHKLAVAAAGAETIGAIQIPVDSGIRIPNDLISDVYGKNGFTLVAAIGLTLPLFSVSHSRVRHAACFS